MMGLDELAELTPEEAQGSKNVRMSQDQLDKMRKAALKRQFAAAERKKLSKGEPVE